MKRQKTQLKPSGPDFPPREAWDFANKAWLPDEQCEAAYLWEFCLGLGGTRIRDALLADRAGFKRKEEISESPAFKEWRKDYPPPAPGGNGAQFDEWTDAATKAFPGWLYHSKLNGHHKDIVRWIIDWPEFPAKHWQQIDSDVRWSNDRHFPKGGMPRWQIGPKQREATEFGTVPGHFFFTESGVGWEEPTKGTEQVRFLEHFLGPSRGYERTTKTRWGLANHKRWEELRMVRVNWARSDRKMKEDFKRWLKDNRPDDRPDRYSTEPKASRSTTDREKLKALGVARVLAAHNGETAKALKFANAQTAPNPLPLDYSNWNRRQEAAAIHLAEFNRKVFG